ncbi:MAG: hypothetical protein DWQ08_10615 [Proteobacteria bacterium]|nr:MAG: hypothetical protein DWQ08_10615 [Pseudomonadota bacterium]
MISDGPLTVAAPVVTTAGGNISLVTNGIGNDLTIAGQITGGGVGTMVNLASNEAELLVFANVLNLAGSVSLIGAESTRIDATMDGVVSPLEVMANDIAVQGGDLVVQAGGETGDSASVIAASSVDVDLAGSMRIVSQKGIAEILGGTIDAVVGGELEVDANGAPARLLAAGNLIVSGGADVTVGGGNRGGATAVIEAGGRINMTGIRSLDVTGGSSNGSFAKLHSTGGDVDIGGGGTRDVVLDSGSGANGSNPNAKIHADGSVNIITRDMTVLNRGGGAQIISNSLSSINIDVEKELVLSSGITGQCTGLECLFLINVNASQAARNAAININYGTLTICNGAEGCTPAQVNLFLDPPPVDAEPATLPEPVFPDDTVESPDSLENVVVALWDGADSLSDFDEEEDGEEGGAFQCN